MITQDDLDKARREPRFRQPTSFYRVWWGLDKVIVA
jgi:hypothetical protein